MTPLAAGKFPPLESLLAISQFGVKFVTFDLLTPSCDSRPKVLFEALVLFALLVGAFLFKAGIVELIPSGVFPTLFFSGLVVGLALRDLLWTATLVGACNSITVLTGDLVLLRLTLPLRAPVKLV